MSFENSPLLSNDLIIQCLNDNYDIGVTELLWLPIGADMNASIYKAQTSERVSYFVKLKRGHDVGVEVLEFLHQAGIQHIIPPIKTVHGIGAQRVEEFTLIVYPFVEGKDGCSQKLTENQWIRLGQTLRQVHETIVPPSIQKRIRKETYSPRWREALRSVYCQFDEELIEDETALKLWKAMHENQQIIQCLIDCAYQLGQKLLNRSSKFVLCHSDIHAGNVLIDGKETLYIVDWEDPIMAPKERDLMFIGGGVANVWNEPEEEKLFYEGYGKVEVDTTILAYYRHERIVEDVAEFALELLYNRDAGKDRDEMFRQFMDMFTPNGVVDIAFETKAV